MLRILLVIAVALAVIIGLMRLTERTNSTATSDEAIEDATHDAGESMEEAADHAGDAAESGMDAMADDADAAMDTAGGALGDKGGGAAGGL